MIRSQVEKAVRLALSKEFGLKPGPGFTVEIPEDERYGDYALNLAGIAKKAGVDPALYARKIAEILRSKQWDVESRGAYVNFKLRPDTMRREISRVFSQGETYGYLKMGSSGKKINIEFISANPTGPLTLGNGRGAFFGEALANILERAGFKVTREYYINDARASNQIRELGKAVLKLSDAYPGPYTEAIRKKLKKRRPKLNQMPPAEAGYLAAELIQKDNRAFIENQLKIKFDVWYSEESLYNKKLVERLFGALRKKDMVYQKDGAWWFKASGFGDTEDRVAIRQDGLPTYFLPDVAYHSEKLTRRKFDKVIDILGADHHGTFPRVLAGLAALGLDNNRVTAVFTQIVRLIKEGKEVKMSKRKGTFVELAELIAETGPDAARYFFLEKSPDTHLDFDLDLAKERSVKNPVYYIQYAHARMASIFKKAQSASRTKLSFDAGKLSLVRSQGEIALIKKLIRFPEIIEDTARDYRIHRLPRYAYELARAFHNFYEKHRVVSEDKELTAARLALVKAARIVLRNTLRILGITAPEKM